VSLQDKQKDPKLELPDRQEQQYRMTDCLSTKTS